METSPHSDRLLDLLYGECSPEEEARLREAIDADDDLADQWRQLKNAHGDVQDYIPPPHQVPDDVCAAILEAASEHSEATDSSPRQGLWTTFVDSGGLRIAASLSAVAFATVVIYLYYGGDVVDDEAIPEQYAAETAVEEDDSSTIQKDFEQKVAAVADDDTEDEAIDDLATSELHALEAAEQADSEALELAEALQAQEEPRQQDSPSIDVESDDGPIALREEPAPSPQAQPAPEDREAGGRAASPRAPAQLQQESDSPGLIGGLGDDSAFGDAAGGDADIAVDDDLVDQPTAAAKPEDEAPLSPLMRARAAYDDGDFDRARSYLDDVDEDQLDDDDLQQLQQLQNALNDE